MLSFSWLSFSATASYQHYIEMVGVLIGGYPIYKEAFISLTERKMTMELSMTIALAAALAIGEIFTALLIIFFVLIAEVLEGFTVSKGRKAIQNLLDLMPNDVWIRDQDVERQAHLDEISAGEIVIVKPGSRIAVDGIVIKGVTFVDQSAITGESIPVEKTIHCEVYAGSINQSGVIEVQATRIGKDTAFGKIIQAVETAEKSRAPIQKTADRLSGYLVYFALVSAVLTYLVTHDIRATISVIIVAGACGVAAGTPLAILGAIGRAASKGCIVKGGVYIEALSRIDTVVFDKTGTLTYGTPAVVAIVPAVGVSEHEVLEAAAVAERHSEHSIAKAIMATARERNIVGGEPDDFDYQPGKGIICRINQQEILVGNSLLFKEHRVDVQADVSADTEHYTEIYIAKNKKFLGIIKITDIIRQEANEAIKKLKEMGLNTILLTGDSEKISQAVALKLGVDKVEAGLLPQQKAERIRELIANRAKVVMVGDGINDAPALTAATVGVAMGAGTDVARECADIVLLGNDLLKFVETIAVARRCHRIIMTNFTGTILVDTVGILLAACGFLSPPLAAFIHVSSELIFILNSARLLPRLSRSNVS
jgi:Cd2+/Zn2+-exporting ATPase/Cu+-exporting ATPase